MRNVRKKRELDGGETHRRRQGKFI